MTKKRITATDVAESIGYTKRGRFYYSSFYVDLWSDSGVMKFGLPVYITDGEYAYPDKMTAKEVVLLYEEYLKNGNLLVEIT